MSQIEELCLEEAFDDTPQMRNFLKVFEEDSLKLKDITTEFQSACQKVYTAQLDVASSIQELSGVTKKMESMDLPLDRDDGSTKLALNQLSSYLDEINSMQQVFTTQLHDNMMFPINKLLSGDFEVLSGLANMYNLVSNEQDQALLRYMKLSKRCTERQHLEAVEDVFQMRRKFHVSSLQYYATLNAIQYERRFAFLDSLTGAIHAHRAFHQLASETFSKSEVEDFLTVSGEKVEKIKHELIENRKRTEELSHSINEQCYSMYYPEAPSNSPANKSQDSNSLTFPSNEPFNPNLSKKSGYLMLRCKTGLLQNRWTRAYFFTQGGNLMTQMRDEVAASLILDLNQKGVFAEATDCDDRRNVFQIVSPLSKKNIVLQAENEKERDEWVSTITNIIMDDTFEKSDCSSDASNALKERSISSFFGSIFAPSSHSNVSSGAASVSQSSTGSFPPTPVHCNTPPLSAQQSFGDNIADWLACQPIQFDLVDSVVPEAAKRQMGAGADGDGEDRINPFLQKSGDGESESSPEWSKDLDKSLLPCYIQAPLIKTFPVRFLGCVAIPSDRGDHLVAEVVRHIMSARATHNMFRMSEMVMVVSNEGVWLVEPEAKCVREEIRLENVAYWTTHKENNRLFGFITRNVNVGEESLQSSFMCYLLECSSGEKISTAIRSATNIAFQIILERRENENSLDDKPNKIGDNSFEKSMELSDKSKSSDKMTLEDDLARHSAGDGDERKVEGAECESQS